MEFSLLSLMTRPRSGPSHADVYDQMQLMTTIADQAGFDIPWFAKASSLVSAAQPSEIAQWGLMAANRTLPIRPVKTSLLPAAIFMPGSRPE